MRAMNTPHITVFGIPNCDTVKKARQWLSAHGLDYQFHDFKKQGVPSDLLPVWQKAAGWEPLVNRKGTTWRGLSDADKARAASRDGAIGLMQQYPSLIKRPVVETGSSLLVGFDETRYTESLGA